MTRKDENNMITYEDMVKKDKEPCHCKAVC